MRNIVNAHRQVYRRFVHVYPRNYRIISTSGDTRDIVIKILIHIYRDQSPSRCRTDSRRVTVRGSYFPKPKHLSPRPPYSPVSILCVPCGTTRRRYLSTRTYVGLMRHRMTLIRDSCVCDESLWWNGIMYRSFSSFVITAILFHERTPTHVYTEILSPGPHVAIPFLISSLLYDFKGLRAQLLRLILNEIFRHTDHSWVFTLRAIDVNSFVIMNLGIGKVSF